uniref:Probable G-protein coupled receptor 173 n=2 Tax=Canis lupus familiaris TaxID=9615 RepID=A0A8C0SKY5_CANLF
IEDIAVILTYVKLVLLGLIMCVSLAGNAILSLLVLKERALHKAPYYFLLDLCLADGIRSAVCFPFVLASVRHSSSWTFSALSCKIVAFMAVLFCFHAAFMLFCISVTRYMAIAHHRFYAKRMTLWTCAAVICMAWTLSVAMAFPPVFDVGTYKFIREEDQCIFEHRYFKANDTLGFMLMLAVLMAATHAVYVSPRLLSTRSSASCSTRTSRSEVPRPPENPTVSCEASCSKGRVSPTQEPFFLSSSPSPSNHLESRHLCQHLPRVGAWSGRLGKRCF